MYHHQAMYYIHTITIYVMGSPSEKKGLHFNFFDLEKYFKVC